MQIAQFIQLIIGNVHIVKNNKNLYNKDKKYSIVS